MLLRLDLIKNFVLSPSTILKEDRKYYDVNTEATTAVWVSKVSLKGSESCKNVLCNSQENATRWSADAWVAWLGRKDGKFFVKVGIKSESSESSEPRELVLTINTSNFLSELQFCSFLTDYYLSAEPNRKVNVENLKSQSYPTPEFSLRLKVLDARKINTNVSITECPNAVQMSHKKYSKKYHKKYRKKYPKKNPEKYPKMLTKKPRRHQKKTHSTRLLREKNFKCSGIGSISFGSRFDGRKIIEDLLLRSGTVEVNPGPSRDGPGQSRQSLEASILVTSYNVRGLTDEGKLRHIINCFHKKMGGKDKDYVVCLQETYIDKAGKIPFLWRGNFHLTPGNGHSCGCITLVSPHINVVKSKNIGNRAHVLACQRTGDRAVSFIIANIYAPCPNSNEKIEFFEELFEVVREFEESCGSSKLIVAGDFNINVWPATLFQD